MMIIKVALVVANHYYFLYQNVKITYNANNKTVNNNYKCLIEVLKDYYNLNKKAKV